MVIKETHKFALAMLAAFLALIVVMAYVEVVDTLREIQTSVTAWQPVMDSHNAKTEQLFTKGKN